MTYRLAFSVRHEYHAGDRSISIPFRFALIEYDGTLYLSRYDEDDEYAERF